jgi:hypothetical protein
MGNKKGFGKTLFFSGWCCRVEVFEKGTGELAKEVRANWLISFFYLIFFFLFLRIIS